ncbi:MAG TPA: hypothetical protein VF936_22080 [Burkholderiales bacterium]
MSLEEFRQHPDLRQQIVRAAHTQRNGELWSLLGRLYAALTAHPMPLRKSRWLAVHHGS